jgi:isoprenylcysteine carboxyl methyltransferase (ICMT) family protein YpbQ
VTAITFTALNAMLLTVRLRCENGALALAQAGAPTGTARQ